MLSNAQNLYDGGDFDSAARLYQAEILANPDDASAHEGLAKSFYKLGRYAEAWEAASRALEIAPDLFIARLVRCDVLLTHNNLLGAESEARAAVEVDPGSVSAYNRLGSVLLLQNKNEEGLSVLRKATGFTPQDWLLHYNISIAFCRMKSFSDGIKDARTAFRLHPTFQTGFWLVQIFLDMNRFWLAPFSAIVFLTSIIIHNWFSFLMVLAALGIPAIVNIGQLKYGEKKRAFRGLAVLILTIVIWFVAYFFVW